MFTRALLLLAVALVLPARARAYDTIITGPLHAPGGGVVGQVDGARASTMRFRDRTHAAVTFTTRDVEIRGEIALDEGEVHVRSTERMILAGSPFRIEVEPGIALRLVDGRPQEVQLESELPVEGLELAHLRVASEEAPSEATQATRDASLLQACQPVYLWAEPRVTGPVIRTSAQGSLMHAPAEGVAGWIEVWLMEHGVWLRGYTWEAMRCGAGRSMMTGSLGTAALGAIETRALAAGAHIAASERAPWTVRVREAMQVQIVPVVGHTYFRFVLTEGQALIEGVLLP